MKFFKRLFAKKIEEADLNKESANAALYYIQEKLKGAPLTEINSATNYVAFGFFMGARWMEDKYGIKE